MNPLRKPVFVHMAQSMIERDAVLYLLEENGIKAWSPEKTISRKVTDTTIDLSYGAFSALSESGFSIFVEERDRSKGKSLVNGFLKETATQEMRLAPVRVDWLSKFRKAALFSLMLPGVMHIVGIYILGKAYTRGELQNLNGIFYLSAGMFVLTFIPMIYMFKDFF